MHLRILFIVFFISLTTSFAQDKTVNERPKLVVGIVIDQMRYDYLTKYWEKYGDDGFKKLVKSGFNCKNTHYNYVPTFTGPGHASIYTGTTPAVHGIIANGWYDKKLNRSLYCTEDKKEKGLMSPANMLTTTITDELRIFNNFRSKVIGIALKDRGAILPAGHSANAAYWLEKSSGEWISSSYYMNGSPEWVKAFNSKKLAQKYLSQTWNTLLPISEYMESAPDQNLYEEGFVDNTIPAVFPYDLKEIVRNEGPELICATPFGNDFTRDFAIEAIKSENLGKGNHTDFITISFSSPDYLGHQFGPQSIEVEDNYLRLDKTLGDLIMFLENQYGKDSFLLFLTADHGGANNMEFMKDHKIPSGLFNPVPLVTSLKSYLNTNYGDGEWILNYSNEQVFLNRNLIEEKKLDLHKMQDKVASFVMQYDGVANAYTSYYMDNASFGSKPASLIQNGYNQKRSGDVILVLEPGWMDWKTTGTTHGTTYNYDTHVPLIWYGWNIKPGNSAENVFITDIAPTVATMLGIPFPNGCVGKSIEEMIREIR